MPWENVSPCHFLFFTASQAVIQPQHFLGRGKGQAWNSYPEVMEAFIYMSTHPHAPLTKESQHFRYLECFTVIIYDKTSSLESVDEVVLSKE